LRLQKEVTQYTEHTVICVSKDNHLNAPLFNEWLIAHGIVFSLTNTNRFTKTSTTIQGQPVYKQHSTGYHWHLDNLHQNHYEVYDSQGRHVGEAAMNGILDETKKVKGRTISVN
jgi:hypothetical protein